MEMEKGRGIHMNRIVLKNSENSNFTTATIILEQTAPSKRLRGALFLIYVDQHFVIYPDPYPTVPRQHPEVWQNVTINGDSGAFVVCRGQSILLRTAFSAISISSK